MVLVAGHCGRGLLKPGKQKLLIIGLDFTDTAESHKLDRRLRLQINRLVRLLSKPSYPRTANSTSYFKEFIMKR